MGHELLEDERKVIRQKLRPIFEVLHALDEECNIDNYVNNQRCQWKVNRAILDLRDIKDFLQAMLNR